MKATDEATHYLKDKVGLKEADRIVAAVRAEALREGANGLAILGLVDSLVSGPKAWNEAIETLRRMADETDRSKGDDCPGREAEQTIPW